MLAAGLAVLLALAALAGNLGLAAPAWSALLLIAAAATALEQCSGYGIDNLSVPLATALLWQQFTP
jgi:phytol kinase